jgi:hypothetical protein
MSLALFVLVIFQIGSFVVTQAGLDHDLSIYASCVVGMTDMHHHAQLVC